MAGQIKKKGTSGAAKNYISRTQAVRKLQISLPDFRRLCIFKGIYPREPRNKKRVSKSATPSTTFYYSRDIQYLLHEPLLAKFRDHKALGKKIARHLGRGEAGDAQRLEKKGATKLSLDHIVKERYPSFADALRDLDDALSLLYLFASLPSTNTVPPKTISLCQRLCREFERYVITSNSLRKSFLSIKGIYYQATIQGQDVLWLVPYKFVQRVTQDVDYRIMGTFVEFYTTLLGFVNFRLYTSIGLVYPPKFDAKSDEQGGELSAFTLEGKAIEEPQQQIEAPADSHTNGTTKANEEVQKQIAAIKDVPDADDDTAQPQNGIEEETNDAIDTFETTAEDADILPQPQASSNEAASLFAPYTFFLSRETPKQSLEFILRAFGCKRIGWDAVLGDGAFTNNETDPAITHQIVDRPPLANLAETQDPEPSSDGILSIQTVKPGHKVPGRIYVQPQWVWDSINQVKHLRPDLYAPGTTLPPHLSPFVRPTKGSYDPTAPLASQEREGEAEEDEGLDDDEEVEDETSDLDVTMTTDRITQDDNNNSDPNGMTVASSSSSRSPSPTPSSLASFTGFSTPSPHSHPPSSPSQATNLTTHQLELEAEATGQPFIPRSQNPESTSSKTQPTHPKSILKPHTPVPSSAGDLARQAAKRERAAADEELERRKMMMGRKGRKRVEKMLYGNRKREEEAEKLRGKRRRIERAGAGRGGGSERV